MKVLILRSIVFDDENESPLVKELVGAYRDAGHDVAVYNMPAADNAEHWAGYAIADYNSWADLMICIDFPTALIQHRRKRVILTKKLLQGNEFVKAVQTVKNESIDFLSYGNSNHDFDAFPSSVEEYVMRGETK